MAVQQSKTQRRNGAALSTISAIINVAGASLYNPRNAGVRGTFAAGKQKFSSSLGPKTSQGGRHISTVVCTKVRPRLLIRFCKLSGK